MTTRVQVGAALLAVLLGAQAPSSAAATDDPTPPQAAVDAVAPGGSAFREALELNAVPEGQTAGTTTNRATVARAVTFGEDLRRSEYLTLAAEGPDHVLPTDFYERGESWLTVEYVDGEPYSAMEVSPTGELLTLDGWIPEEIEAIDAAPVDATIATDGRYGEAYAITGDGTTALALNTPTRDFIGGPSIPVAELRVLKAEQEAAREAGEPEDLPPGSMGSTLGAEPSSAGWPPALWVAVAMAGALLVGGATYVLGRSSRRGGER